MTSVATSTRVEVKQSGELVILTMGNFEVSMHFEAALSWSAEILACAKAAGIPKRARYRVAGILTDAGAKPTVLKHVPETVKRERLSCDAAGTTVNLKIGRVTAGVSAENAAQLAQWLRVRGKQARNSVRERANWAELAQADRVMENVKDRLQ